MSKTWAQDIAAFAALGFISSSAFSIALSQSLLGISLFFLLVSLLRKESSVFLGKIPTTWWALIAGLTVWFLIAALFSGNRTGSLIATKEEWLFLAVPVSLLAFSHRHTHKLIVPWLAGTVLIFSLYGILQIYGIDHAIGVADTLLAPGDRIHGNFSHPLTFANYFGMICVFLFVLAIDSLRTRFNWHALLLWPATGVSLVATILSGSRTAIAGLCVSVLALAILRKGRWRIGAVAAFLAIVVLSVVIPVVRERFTTEITREVSTSDEGSRLFIWQTSLQMILDSPLVGTGTANFPAVYHDKVSESRVPQRQMPHSHNDLLNVSVMGGIPAGLLFIGLWIVMLQAIWKNYRTSEDRKAKVFAAASLTASAFFLVSSLTDATFTDEEVRLGLMIVWAAGLTDFSDHDS